MANLLRFDLASDGPSHIDALHYLAARTEGEPSARPVESIWFDTPERELLARGLVLRIDLEGDRKVQAVSLAGEGTAASEWRTELVGDGPEPNVLPEGAARRILERPGIVELLGPVFRAMLTRAERRLRLQRGGEARLVLETGEIRAGERVETFRLGTLELLAGGPAQLYQIALRLHRESPFRLGAPDLAARGYALVAPVEPVARKARPVDLDPGLTTGEAFRRIAASCLAHWTDSEACALAGEDPEGVHQVRVAARRLRSAISVFKEALPTPWTGRLSREVRRFTHELADAREWDVFLGETLAPLRATLPDDPGLTLLASRGEAARGRAYERVRAAIADPRYTRLLLELGRWLAEPWEAPSAAVDVARAVLEARHAKVLTAGAELARLDAEGLHRLRIRVKQLRYAVEFFDDLFAGGASRRYARALERLQAALGMLQDVAMTPPLLDSVADSNDPALAHAKGIVMGWQAASAQRARARLHKRFERFAACKRFW
jgi:CHAD domain-containing protein